MPLLIGRAPRGLDARWRRGCSRSDWRPVDAESAIASCQRSDKAGRRGRRRAISARMSKTCSGLIVFALEDAHRSLAASRRSQCVARNQNRSPRRRVRSGGVVVVGDVMDAPLPAAAAEREEGVREEEMEARPANFMLCIRPAAWLVAGVRHVSGVASSSRRSLPCACVLRRLQLDLCLQFVRLPRPANASRTASRNVGSCSSLHCHGVTVTLNDSQVSRADIGGAGAPGHTRAWEWNGR